MIDIENVDEKADGERPELNECCQLTGLIWDSLPETLIPNVKSLFDKYKDTAEQLSRSLEEKERLTSDLQNHVKLCEVLENTVKLTKSTCEQRVLELERKLAEYEGILKAAKEKMASTEAHHTRYLEETAARTNSLISHLTKKMETIEKEKNDTVVRYAMREAEIMRLKDEKEKYEKEKKALLSEMVMLKKSTEAEQLEKLEKELEEKQKDLIMEKKIQRETEAEYQMALKRIEAGQTAINELRLSLEHVQKQLAWESEAKAVLNEDYKKLVHQLQMTEKLKNDEVEAAKKETMKNEVLYEKTLGDLASIREEKDTLEMSLKELGAQYQELNTKNETNQKELEDLKLSFKETLEKLRLLENIHTQVNSSLRRAEEAEKNAEIAKVNMEQAEVEANECRKQAERMLEVTEQLTEKNSALSSECEVLKEKLKNSKDLFLKTEAEMAEFKKRVEEKERNLNFLESSTSTEIAALKLTLKAKTTELEELLQKLEEANNEKEVIKKKNASFVKELRAELYELRKKETLASEASIAETQESENICLTANGGSASSRASSVSSVDLNSRTTNGSSPIAEQGNSGIQQQMVEKIVKLQRTLARKQEKVEFLEEHVQQCTRELCKKTKIIQNYALREEAALLMPSEDSLSKVPLSRRSGGVSLMGSMFSTGDKKTELELATEVNSRLQAVLEDILYKNITLKTNLDTLGEEIARLSRENRQLSLQKTHDC